jgi:hypothetical protein
VVFAALVIACFAAFAVTQRLKHTPAAVQEFKRNPAFYPTAAPVASCRGTVPKQEVNATKRVEYFSFKPAQADEVTVEVVDSADRGVATIVRDLPAERYKPLSLCWNGQRGPTERGGLAPPGEYRLRVRLRSEELTKYAPLGFTLEAPR